MADVGGGCGLILAASVVHFLQSWIPQVLRLRRVYASAYFDSQSATWDPSSAFAVRSHAAAGGQNSPVAAGRIRAGISVVQFVKDGELCKYLDAVLVDLYQLLVEQDIADIAVVVWERSPRRPLERHVLSLHNVYAAALALASDGQRRGGNDGDAEEDEVRFQSAVNEALRLLWAAYKIKEATIDPLPSSLQLTWTLAIRPRRPIDAPDGWDSGQASVIAADKHIVPVRTFPLLLQPASAEPPSIAMSIEVLAGGEQAR